MGIRTSPLLLVVLAGPLSWLLAGCAGEGSYRLHLVFPDQQTRDAVSLVTLWALAPAGHSCDEIQTAQIRPEDLLELSRLDVEQPIAGPETLGRVPTGEVLFVGEGWTAGGARLLLGCTATEVKAGATVEVTVELACVCQPVTGTCAPIPEITGNGIDDDCDGLTDECVADRDCDDGIGCTADTCSAGSCHHANFPNGLQCSDGSACTLDDACLEGVCTGAAKDCSALDGICVLGACDPASGACFQQAAAEGSPCDDGLFCTEGDACQSGVCGGVLSDCADQDACTLDSCNEAEQRCEHLVTPKPGAEGPAGDATCANGLDDDCDSLTDGDDPNCAACTVDAECEDHNGCTDDSCAGGNCHNTPLSDGSACDDGRACTTDVCRSGTCQGTALDCTALDDACHVGVCVEASGGCLGQARTDGTACEDQLFCTVGDACQSGECQGMARDCADADSCTLDGCDESGDRCTHELQPRPGAEEPPGDPKCGNGIDDDCDGLTDLADPNCVECLSGTDCDDLNECTNDACNAGVCQNTPKSDGTPCGSGLRCVGGACTCDTTSCASGCCQGGTCHTPSLDACGIGGVECVACDPGIADNCSTEGSCQCGGGAVCSGATPLCLVNQCVAGNPSCNGLAATCGASGDMNCCASRPVPGGTFYRSYDTVTYTDTSFPATVTDFELDVYEVTVGRFRKFVEAGYGTQANPPAVDSGANPNLSGSGWQSGWNTNLSASTSGLISALKCQNYTWTDTPGANENHPINCITWFDAFAFCIWDGGRLPTEAEWNYAAAGGSEQRVYPWSNPPNSTTIGDEYAVYCGSSCTATQNVGSKSPAGDGRWGHADMAGNLWEWVLDWYASPYANPCSDCANLTTATNRVLRGGNYGHAASQLLSSARGSQLPAPRSQGRGVRCVRLP